MIRLGLLLVVVLAVGFAWFVHLAAAPPVVLPVADGIVVLTGGSRRVEQGVRLLARGQAPRLLVSGVAPGATVTAVVRGAGMDPAPFAGRITLGYAATSTHGNALETVEWVRRYGVRSLIVVTAFYHMPRAMAELRPALPGVALFPSPVLPDALRQGQTRVPLILLGKEYLKFLALQIGWPRASA